jgi:hypothetical protein
MKFLVEKLKNLSRYYLQFATAKHGKMKKLKRAQFQFWPFRHVPT